MRNARVLAAVYLAVLAASVLAVDVGDRGDRGRLADVELTSSLHAFEACDEALAYFVEGAAEQAAAGRRDGGTVAMTDEEIGEQAAEGFAREAAPAPAAADGAGAFSGTTVQEAGVDEPDLVKTDGRRIVTVAGERLHVLDARAEPPALAGSLDLPGQWGAELLLAGDRALALSTTWSERPAAESSRLLPGGTGQTVLTLVDLSEVAPRVAATLTLDGEYVSARMVDGVARVVLRSPSPAPGPVGGTPAPMPEAPAAGPPGDGEQKRPDAVDDQDTIDAWVPSYRREGAGGTTSDRLVGCDQIYRPAEFAGLGMVSVLSVDLGGDLTPSAAATVVADAQTVYASPGTLYVAFTGWESDASTQIHAFDITDPAAAVYRASGAVRGRLLNQWSLSEHAGHLRVATTEGELWAEPMVDAVPPPAPSHSAVTVLATSGQELVAVGRVEGLGPDERIYAVRFLGDVGYVVTFRETDPLYTLDLSDPADPRVLGELKILGYSAYLHPLGEGLLLGVGQDATEQGELRGTQLSLFDVSDLTDPRRVQQVTVAGAHSAVEYDHRAFLHWPATGTIVLPLEVYPDRPALTEADVFTGVAAFTVDPSTGFTEVGRLSHTGHTGEPWTGAIRRSLVVGDTLYTVSESGIGAADLATLTEQAWIPLR